VQIGNTLSDDAVLEELGRRLQRHRLDRNITQGSLAREAGISTPTLQRLAAGSSVQFVSLLRILRALGLLDHVDMLVPTLPVRPMELLERKGRRRKRASPGGSPETNKPWTWED